MGSYSPSGRKYRWVVPRPIFNVNEYFFYLTSFDDPGDPAEKRWPLTLGSKDPCSTARELKR